MKIERSDGPYGHMGLRLLVGHRLIRVFWKAVDDV